MADGTITIEWEYEVNLVMGITDGMFKASRIVNGNRMYPYISIDDTRYYLEGDH